MFILKPIICTSIMMIVSIIIFNYLNSIKIGDLATILSLIAGSLIYIVMVIFLKVFEKEEIDYINIGKKSKIF